MSNVTSQSELTTKEIVEQAIQDYHESILPYLNGMVPTIANKFDKANLYSTDEQIVGRWIDGKPLYQKTYNATNVSATQDYELDDFTDKNIVWTTGNIVNANDGNVFPLPYAYTTSLACVTKVGSSSKLVLRTYQLFNLSSAEAIVYYTKTTDEAIAIGSDTDYSLEEKIVGTDTDGKYVYQKTYVNTPISNASGIVTIDSNITRSNTNLKCAFGVRKVGSSSYSSDAAIPYNADGQSLAIHISNSGLIAVYSGLADGMTFDTTIRYTKTTD